jgi:hypothetical protein
VTTEKYKASHVDRVVSNLSYTQSNCCVIYSCFNLAKKQWIDADVITMAETLLRKQGG